MLNKERIQNTKTTTTTTLARLPSGEESWLPSESKRTGGQSVRRSIFDGQYTFISDSCNGVIMVD